MDVHTTPLSLFAAFLHMESDVMESSGSTSYESESITVPSEEDPESSNNDELLNEQPPRGYTPLGAASTRTRKDIA